METGSVLPLGTSSLLILAVAHFLVYSLSVPVKLFDSLKVLVQEVNFFHCFYYFGECSSF